MIIKYKNAMSVSFYICTGIGNAFSSGFNAVKNVVSNVGESIGSGISSIGNVLSK